MNIIENIRTKFPVSSELSLAPDEVARMEAMLQGTLVPMAPRKDFVERLNRQLITSAPLARKQSAPLVSQDQRTRESLLIGVATLFGAAMVFATGFRVAITLLGLAGFLAQWLNRNSTNKQTPVQPAI